MKCEGCYYFRPLDQNGKDGYGCHHLYETGVMREREKDGNCLSYLPRTGKTHQCRNHRFGGYYMTHKKN